jgi:hypothetical protein
VSTQLRVRIEWLDAPGVSTPELAATWGRYEVWVGDRCVTQVEAADGTFRRSVYGSLYPLAEWIAENWWSLIAHVRPSAVDARYWTWANVREQSWLARHNARGAGDGMAWPDLTLVPEGLVTRVRWAADRTLVFRQLRFVSNGESWIPSDDIQEALATTVEHVLDRLAEQDLPKTRLAEEWAAITASDADEREFCFAAARLGLDPYAVDEPTAEEIVRVGEGLPDDLAGEFFDSAEPSALVGAVEWIGRSLPAAARAARKARRPVLELHEATQATTFDRLDPERPWIIGYQIARRVRETLDLVPTQLFDIQPWVGRATVSAPSRGIQGAVAVESGRCGVVLGTEPLDPVFGMARALGRALLRPEKQRFLLSGVRRDEERAAGAFAAELLAPAEGIREMLAALGTQNDSALDAVAGRYRVSPLLVRHQYDNQLAPTSA